MKIKELQKTVNIAWSPRQQYPIYLAAGTAAQQFDSSVNSSLEIYSTNFADPSYDLQLKASVPSPYRFQKLLWSPTGCDGAHPNGLIVGGCESGHVVIYSASKMLAKEEGLLARQDKHTGPVSGLDFNPFQANLLASSASESEIFIWDLNNPTTHMNPGTKTQPLEDVKNVAWNRQVQHILASVFSTRCVIWDLRKSEQIIKLSDLQSHVRWHAIQWHPEVATQVWLASEDDHAPVVQMWDLRYATAPAKTMQIHQRGVLGMSWCPRDTDMMVSCGKDNRIYCWNPNTDIPEGEILSEIATTATWYSDVQWCPRNPALIASSCLDGVVSIYSLFGGTQQQVQTSNKIADSFPGMDKLAHAPVPQQSTQTVYHDLKRPPKWTKKPVGVSFGFGGKLVHFNANTKQVNVSQVVTEPELVERAVALENSLRELDVIEYCKQRADAMPDQSGRYLWYFLKANFEPNPKEEILNLLGYNKEDIDSKFSKYIQNDDSNDVGGGGGDQLQNDITDITNRLTHMASQRPLDNDAVFDGIAASQKQITANEKEAKKQFKIPSGDHKDTLIAEALLTGNLEAAVELCLDMNRPSEALIIASAAGIDFLSRTQVRVLKQQKSELSCIISALVSNDWLKFVNSCTVDSWKEALVAALQHGDRKLTDICERLGDRLMAECPTNVEYLRNGILCYICSGSIEKLVDAWYQLKQVEHQNDEPYLSSAQKQELAEIVMLMSKSLQLQRVSVDLKGPLARFATDYTSLLASQGAFRTALEFICALGSSEDAKLIDLRDCLYNIVNDTRKQQQQHQQQQQKHHQPQQNAHIRPQPRGSFSLPGQPAPMGYAPTSMPNNMQNNCYAPPAQSLVGGHQPPLLPPANPTIFNPLQAGTLSSAQPPLMGPPHMQPSDTLMQPPRPLSATSAQGSGSGSGGLLSRAKHVLDPSVASSGPSVGGYGVPYNPVMGSATNFNNSSFSPVAPAPINSPLSGGFNTSPFNAGLQQPSTTGYSNMTGNYMPGMAQVDTSAQAPVGQSQPPLQNIQRNPTPPPGWNDPPALRSSKATKKVETAPTTTPIVHPLFAMDPNQNPNGYLDPNMPYQSNNAMASGPPPSGGPGVGGYLNPASAGSMQNNNQMSPPMGGQQNYGYQTTAVQQPIAQQQQQWNNQPPQQSMGYTEQPATIHQQRQPEPPKEKPPLPEEFIYLQTILEELKNQCLNTATDPRTKRKFVDVTKRLENLYDCLREGKLSTGTTTALNQIIQYIQVGDYASALQVHTQIAFSSDFSQCSGFMPGLKVLVQSANELQVYLQ